MVVITTTSFSSPILSSTSQSDDNMYNSSSVGVTVAIVVLVVVVLIIITVVVIGIIVVWKERKNKQHTKTEDVYYSTIDETTLQKNKPEATNNEVDDKKLSKENPRIWKLLKVLSVLEQTKLLYKIIHLIRLLLIKLKCKTIQLMVVYPLNENTLAI